MNLKRIGAMSLATAALASVSVFGASAAQADGTETLVTTYESKSKCVSGNKETAKMLELFGNPVVSSTCKEDYASFSGYRGFVTYEARL